MDALRELAILLLLKIFSSQLIEDLFSQLFRLIAKDINLESASGLNHNIGLLWIKNWLYLF
ncbi:protein of unknown function [Vibrio tapetis subsp. tapetis]|uniref:Uncharacterized protein n=1 Tax=Vibrio tapetis subsp. tapetis TaxID=1671868 RepID=A0A2N8ZE04_9VIBR|nr:protein of unknown function [Vibrio tapetis subsp. tapetis]